MYSVVLMAALTTGGSAPDFCHHCAYAGYYSSNCYGCYGGSYYGAPYGNGCYGYGAWGACGGSWGCYGGSWGGGAIDYNCFGCHGCYGCYGGFGCTGFNPYGTAQMAPEPIPAPKPDEKKPGGMGSVAPDRAKVIVQLPTGAKLYVDDQPIKTTADSQAFNTPKLDPGQTYYYEVRAEVVRDGKTVVESKRILVRGGQEVSVAFPKLEKEAPGIASVDAGKGR
jgi:uncharacterized protein (TIGR03000 family)